MRPENRILFVFIVAVLVVVAGGVALIWLTAPQPSFEERFCGYGPTSAAKPYILLNASTPAVLGETVTINRMIPSGQYSAGCYSVDLSLNGTPGTPSRLPAGTGGTVEISFAGSPPPAPGPISVRWTDPDGDGNLSLGDFFTVTYPGGLPSPDSYTLSILWWDGSTLASVNFQLP